MEDSVAVQLGSFVIPRARNYLEAAWAVSVMVFLGEAGQRTELIILVQATSHPNKLVVGFKALLCTGGCLWSPSNQNGSQLFSW